MEFLSELWLPIVVAAVLVFVVSSVMHMVLPYHKSDFEPLPDEPRTLDALRAAGIRPGSYMFPHCGSMKDMKSPEFTERMRRGPVGTLRILDGMPSMGKALGQWFVFCLLVGFFVAYIAWHAPIAPGSEYLVVFRLTGSIAFLGYGLTSVMDSIWKGQRWGVTFKFVFDGLVYALVTAGSFAWLWPSAV